MNPHDLQNGHRRQVLKGAGVLAAGAAASGWILPALAQGERLIPFTDVPEAFQVRAKRPGATHYQDTRLITSHITSNDDFYVVQHYGQPEIDNAAYRLRVTGMVERELEFSLADFRGRDAVDLQAGFECGGNSPGLFNGLIGNANWRGVSLRAMLEEAGIRDGAKEVVFFGADKATEEIRDREVEKAFARGMSIEDAMRPENLLAYEMNGEPLPLFHGKPLRLIVPGWYGVANVKWLTQIHVQDTRYMGRFMGRDYVTLKRVIVGGEERWVENSVTAIQLKSAIVRVTEMGGEYRVLGFVLNDGTPLRSVEVSVDGGPWQPADLSEENTQYSWKLFTFNWDNPAPGDHTIVSRVIDSNGNVQPTMEEFPEKATRWENNAQFPRSLTI